MIKQSDVKKDMIYNPETGILLWRYKNSKRGRPTGDIRITYKAKTYSKNKIIWLYMTGYYPKAKVKHLDDNPLNCKFTNLAIDDDQLTMNVNHNNCGFIVNDQSYSAFIIINGVTTDLGMYNDADVMLEVVKTCLKSMINR